MRTRFPVEVEKSATSVTSLAVNDLTGNTKGNRPIKCCRLRSDFSLPRSQRAFTMIEIAIAVGVIGFALVAIIGILPRGMNVQKDNREDTIVSQDAPYFMNAIRNGEMRTNNGVLTNYVETIFVTNISVGGTTVNAYSNPNLASGSNNILTNDMNIIGLLCTPELDLRPTFGSQTNYVAAVVRAMTGSAVQQNGANAATAFRYLLTVEIDSWNYTPAGYPFASYVPFSPDQMNYMASCLHEVRLRFAWPYFPNGNIGPGRQTYRSVISSHLTNYNNNGFWFFQPNSYSNITNS
jgi:type II secretory pathway pseudopilin PulG